MGSSCAIIDNVQTIANLKECINWRWVAPVQSDDPMHVTEAWQCLCISRSMKRNKLYNACVHDALSKTIPKA
jgi:hypothetical protein